MNVLNEKLSQNLKFSLSDPHFIFINIPLECLATFAMFAQQSWESCVFGRKTEIKDSTGGATCFSTICDFAVIWTRRTTRRSTRCEIRCKRIIREVQFGVRVAPRFVGTKSVEAVYCAYPVRVVSVALLVQFRHSLAMDHASYVQHGNERTTPRIRNVLWT